MGDTPGLDPTMPIEDESIILYISSGENLFLARAVLDRARTLAATPRTEERDAELRIAFGLTRRMLDLTREASGRNEVRIRGMSN